MTFCSEKQRLGTPCTCKQKRLWHADIGVHLAWIHMMKNETHVSRDDISMERLGDAYEAGAVQWGRFNVSFERALADMDVTPYLKGLPDDLDQCPHWGFVFKGRVIIRYKDRQETINAGEAYYVAPGHTTVVTKGTELIEFSPVAEIEKTMAAITKNLQAQEKK